MSLRWALNISRWQTTDEEFAFLLDLVPEAEQKEVRSFKFLDDRKRALCSRLLQRHCTCQALGLDWREVVIKRTRGRKPFAAGDGQRSKCPNFKLNVPHEVRHVRARSKIRSCGPVANRSVPQGQYVVLAAERLCVCGIDVAAPQHVRTVGRKMSVKELRQAFEKQLTCQEVSLVRRKYSMAFAWPSN